MQSMEAYWSSHKTAPLQMLVYNATLLTKMQSAALPEEHPAVYKNIRPNSNIFEEIIPDRRLFL